MATRGPSRGKARPPARPEVRPEVRARRRSVSDTSGSLTATRESQRWVSALPARSRLTGRMAVLVLVLAVLTVSYASSLRAYLHQRSHIEDLKVQIAEREASVKALEREKRRWEDPAYIRMQARQRFGYVMPGETGLQVIDIDGKPLGSEVALPELEEGAVEWDPTWWETTWQSVELAGVPPKKAKDDAAKDELIAPPKGQG
ncbi:MAG: septum formation initiator family protein [Nocardioides sp.]